MTLTLEEARALLKVLENQFIDYDNQVAINTVKRLQQFVDANKHD